MKRVSAAHLVLVVAALVVGGVSIALAAPRLLVAQAQPEGKASLPASLDAVKQAGEPKKITRAKVEAVTTDNVLRLTGTLVADTRAEVASTTNGIVQEVSVERGSIVEEGQTLVKVDPADAQNMLAEGEAGLAELRAALGWEDPSKPFKVEEQPGVKIAKAGLELSETTFKRHTELQKRGALSQQVFDQSQTEFLASQQKYQAALHQARQTYHSYLTAQAKMAIVRKLVADTVLTAPFSGVVTERYVSKGERVTTNPMGAGAKIVSLVKLDPLRLVLTVPEQHAALVHAGQQVRFTVDSCPGQSFAAEVRYVAVSVESNTRALSAEAMVANPDRVLRPGFFASAELVLPDKRTELYVPATSVIRSGSVTKAYVIHDGVAREQVISLGGRNKDQVEVTAGLAAGDEVVDAPAQIQDGDRVS